MVEDGGLDLLVVADTRTGDVWQAGSARRGRGGVGLDITILPAAVVEANRHDLCCYVHDVLREGRVFYYVADVSPLDPE